MSLPYQIEQMSHQIGNGLNGGFAYIGASKKYYTCKYPTGGATSTVLPNGTVDAPVSLVFNVNGKKGAGWKIIVSLEPSDTYTVRLWKPSKISLKKQCQLMSANQMVPVGTVMATSTDVYCDQLQGCIEAMYDKSIREHNNGWIPMG